ncbi:MAG: hypothetical protein GWP75_09105 [Planctomycetia bacterium]|nr:hypothetical protein [Planctomycetia bacterium]
MKHRIVGAVLGFAMVLPAPVGFADSLFQTPVQNVDPVAVRPLTRSAAIGETTLMLDDVIDRRSRELATAPPSGSDQRIVHDARRGVRRITVELAMLGRERGDAGTLAGFHAIRLDATMRSIDRLLGSLARPGTLVGEPPRVLPETERVAAIERLDAFNRTGLDLLRRSDTGTVEGLDGTLATILAPLRDVFSVLTGRPLQSRWPIESESIQTDLPATRNAQTSPIDARVMTMLEAQRVHAAAFDVKMLDRVLATTPFDADDPVSVATWGRVADVLDCLQDARGEESPLATSTLRSVRRDAIVRSRTALQQLQRTLETSEAPASPSLREEDVVAIRTVARTLRAVRRLDAIAVGLASMHPAATRKAARLVASRGRMLNSPHERDRTLAWIDRIIGELDRYEMVDFESRLRDPDAPTIELIGGRTLELSDAVATTRRAWVDAVTKGDIEGPAFDAMDRMARLGTLLEHLVSFVPTDDVPILDLERCDRWGGWYVDATTLGWSNRTLLPGVRLAVGSGIAGDSDRFERELATLESQGPPVRLAAVIARRTRDTTATLPGGGVATIAAAAIPPEPSAWGVPHRIQLAAACIGMAELVAIRAHPDLDDPDGMEKRDRLARAVARACEGLLAALKPGVPAGKEIRP